jgi:hypothetical protein
MCAVPAALLVMAVWLTTLPAQAQQMIAAPQSQHDRVRVSGFLWRAKPGGSLNFEELAQVPGFEQGIDVTDGLGFEESSTGWIIEGNVAAGRRHRFLVELSRLEASAEQTFNFPGFGPVPPIIIGVESDLNLREFHAFYNFLFVATPQVEFGVLGGVGWFDAEASVLAPGIGRVSATLDQAFPSFGGNLLVNPDGPVRGYLELSGFPRVEINDLSGSQLDLVARVEVFPVRNFGIIAGYRRYRLVFDDASDNLAFDLTWDGFTFGAQLRY